MKLPSGLAIRVAALVLRAGGLKPYFDIRASSSAKDVIGAKLADTFPTFDQLSSYRVDDARARGMRVVWRMYADLHEVDNRTIAVPAAPENTQAPEHGQRIVAGVMGNIRAHNGAPPINVGSTEEKSL